MWPTWWVELTFSIAFTSGVRLKNNRNKWVLCPTGDVRDPATLPIDVLLGDDAPSNRENLMLMPYLPYLRSGVCELWVRTEGMKRGNQAGPTQAGKKSKNVEWSPGQEVCRPPMDSVRVPESVVISDVRVIPFIFHYGNACVCPARRL